MVAVKLTIRSRLLLVIVPLVVAPLVACGVLVYLLLSGAALEEDRGFLEDREREVRQFVEQPTEPTLAEMLEILRHRPESEEAQRCYVRAPRYVQAYFSSLQSSRPEGQDGGRYLALRVFDHLNRELFKAPSSLPPGAFSVEELAPTLWRARLFRPGQPPLTTPRGERRASAYPVYGPAGAAEEGAPVDAGGREFLGVAVLEYRYPLATFRRQARLAVLLSVGMTVGLAAAVVFLITRVVHSLVDPVEALARASEAVANGDLSARAPVVSDDEIGSLARTFNEMTERLSVTIRALEELNEQLEDKVEARTSELAQAQALKNEFLSNVSHELRTPLNSILNLTKILLARKPGDINQEQETQLSIIERNAAKLHDLIESILDLAAVRTGSVRLALEEVDLGRLLQEIEAPCRTMAANKNLEFILEAPAVVPAVVCDSDRTKQAILHLVNNAVKFTNQGYVKVGCEVDPLALGDYVRCYVTDTGPGVAKDRQERIFQEFVQADGSITRAHGGAGVGLSLVKRLVVAMGGEVQVSSEAGEGSTFSFTLPVSRAQAASAAGASPPSS